MDQETYMRGVRRIRAAIADGIVYQANLCRILTAPLPGDVDLAGLGADSVAISSRSSVRTGGENAGAATGAGWAAGAS